LKFGVQLVLNIHFAKFPSVDKPVYRHFQLVMLRVMALELELRLGLELAWELVSELALLLV
jgi:hypothetical protein